MVLENLIFKGFLTIFYNKRKILNQKNKNKKRRW